jgi:hypothetical protein
MKTIIAPRVIHVNCWAGHDVELTMTATDGIRAMYRGTCKCGEEIKIEEILQNVISEK